MHFVLGVAQPCVFRVVFPNCEVSHNALFPFSLFSLPKQYGYIYVSLFIIQVIKDHYNTSGCSFTISLYFSALVVLPSFNCACALFVTAWTLVNELNCFIVGAWLRQVEFLTRLEYCSVGSWHSIFFSQQEFIAFLEEFLS